MTTVKKTPPAEEVKPALNIYQKLHMAKQSMGKVVKNATNPHLKRNYADINSIIDTVEPILLDHGLLLIQPIIDEKVCTIIVDVETGDKIDCYLTLPPITDAQKLGGAITYFRRYTLVSLLSLQAADDDKVKDIKEIVCKYFGINLWMIESRSRKREIVEPRQIATTLVREFTRLSLKGTGLRFGGLDHSSIIHSLSTVNDLIITDKDYRKKFEYIKMLVQAKLGR